MTSVFDDAGTRVADALMMVADALMIADALMALDKLFDSPERWTKGVSARDATGHSVKPCDPTAVRWCLAGGVEKVVPQRQMWTVLQELHRRIGGACSSFNDHPETTFARVKAVLHDS